MSLDNRLRRIEQRTAVVPDVVVVLVGETPIFSQGVSAVGLPPSSDARVLRVVVVDSDGCPTSI